MISNTPRENLQTHMTVKVVRLSVEIYPRLVVRLRFVTFVRSGVVPAILSCAECIGLVHKENVPEVLK